MSPRYQITQNEVAVRQFKSVIEQSKRDGRLREVIDAGKAMLEQLSIDPYKDSETRGFYPIIRLYKRVAFFSPLTVYYIVEDARSRVTIFGIRMRDSRKK